MQEDLFEGPSGCRQAKGADDDTATQGLECGSWQVVSKKGEGAGHRKIVLYHKTQAQMEPDGFRAEEEL